MLDQPGSLVVPQDRQPVPSPGVPAAFPGAIHLCRGDREGGISNVEKRNLRIRGDWHDTIVLAGVVLVEGRTEIDKSFRVLARGNP